MATEMASSTTPAPAAAAAPQPAWGIAWGGGLLVLLSMWLRAKFPDLSVVLIGATGLLGAGALALALWQLVRTLRQEPNAPAEVKSRREAGVVCLVAGAAMLVLSVALGVTLRLGGFGEFVGLGLFALTALFSGKALLSAGPADATALWTKVRASLGMIKAALAVGGAGMLIALASLAWGIKPDGTWWPEYLALLFGGLTFLFTAFWLQLQTATGEIPLMKLRVCILVVGGVAGLLVTLMILARMYVWRNEVFIGGLEVWLGDGFWRFWLCAYVLLAGLALMFGSLLLAHSDIHENVVLRRSLYGYNTVFNGLLLLATLILANIFFYILIPYTINWSRTSFSTLAASSKSVLAKLKEPTTIYVLMGEGHPAMSDLRALMDNCRIENNRLKVIYLSPDLEPRKYLDLAARFKEIQPDRADFRGLIPKRGVLLVYGEIPDDAKKPVPPYAFVADNKIFEDTGGPHAKGRSVRVFKAEGEILKELHHLSAGKQKRKLYFLQGNGELDINNNEPGDRTTYHDPLSIGGCAKLVALLKKDEYDVQGLAFDSLIKAENVVIPAPTGPEKRKDVPDDAYALVIPGASEPMSKETLDALERYVDRGGRLLVFFETIFDAKYTKMRLSGLEDFLRKYGVDVRPEFAIMLPTRTSGTREIRDIVALPPTKPETELAKRVEPSIFFTARVIKTLPPAGPYKAEPLLQLDSKRGYLYWAETDPRAIGFTDAYTSALQRNLNALQEKFLREPLPVAVTVTQGAGELAKPRMVVFGDADNILNDDRQLRLSYDLVASSLEWMSEKGGYIGPRPREQSSYTIPLAVDDMRLFVYPGLLMLLAIAGLGTALWLVRRK